MAKVKSLYLNKGTRIGNYEIIEAIGRGCEGEVYKVKEIPTDAVRAMKIYQMDIQGKKNSVLERLQPEPGALSN
jgi:hypothetical protein